MKRFIILSLLLILSLGFYFYFSVSADIHVEKIDIQSTKKEVLKEINDTQKYVDTTSKWMDSNEELNDTNYLNPEHEEEAHKETDPKRDVINYFVTGIFENDLNIFMSAFYVQSISEDLFMKEEIDKTKVVEDMIESISRKGTIRDIHYEDVKGINNSYTNEVNLTFIYEDNKKALVNLNLKEQKDSHTEHEKGVYVITTSAWNIIKQIENSTQ